MEIAQASAASIPVRGFAGKDWRMPLLDMGDIGELQREVPTPNGRVFADIFELAEWAKTAEGSVAVLLRSLQKIDPSIDAEKVARMGSITQRVNLAEAIAIESMVSGEEGGEDDSQKKAQSHGTG